MFLKYANKFNPTNLTAKFLETIKTLYITKRIKQTTIYDQNLTKIISF